MHAATNKGQNICQKIDWTENSHIAMTRIRVEDLQFTREPGKRPARKTQIRPSANRLHQSHPRACCFSAVFKTGEKCAEERWSTAIVSTAIVSGRPACSLDIHVPVVVLRVSRRKKNGREVCSIAPYFRAGMVLRSRAEIGLDHLAI